MKKIYEAPYAVQEKLDGGELCLVIDGGGAASSNIPVEAPEREEVDPDLLPKDGWQDGLW